MKAYIASTTGCGKRDCEDAAVVGSLVLSGESAELEIEAPLLVGVLDGVGGNAGGGIASKRVAAALSAVDFAHTGESAIRKAITNINASLIESAKDNPGKERMATTATCLIEGADGIYLVHAGNTRAYVMQGGYLNQLTTDHTTKEFLRSLGCCDKAMSCRQSEINCCLGGGDKSYLERLHVKRLLDPFESMPAVLLFTSDGVHDYIELEDMESILSAEDGDIFKAAAMVRTASNNGSTDDKTAIIVRR